MERYYGWFVFIHLIGLVLFAISHGASAFIAFPSRQERDPLFTAAGIGALLDTRRPDILVAVGTIGLVVLVWLMVLEPG